MFRSLLIIIISSISFSVFANEVALGNQNNIHLGFNMGNTSFNHDNLYNKGEIDTKDSKWSLYGGYRFFPWLSVEGQYSNLGEYMHTADSSNFSIDSDKYSSITGAAKFNYDFNQYVEVFAKSGLSFLSLRQKFTYPSGNAGKFDSYGLGLYFAVGSAFHMTENISLVAQYDTHMFQVEAVGLFGNSEYYFQNIGSANLGLQVTF